MKQFEVEWPRQWTLEVGKNIKAVRLDKGLSAQQLSDRCAVIGFVVPRNSISNLENGRKEAVTIQEIVVVAFALGCPPVTLLYPLTARKVHALPGSRNSAFFAAQWFSGLWEELPADGWELTAEQRTDASAEVLELLREYVGLQHQRQRLLKVLPTAPEDSRVHLNDSLHHAEGRIYKLKRVLPDQYGVEVPESKLWADA